MLTRTHNKMVAASATKRADAKTIAPPKAEAEADKPRDDAAPSAKCPTTTNGNTR